MIVYLYNSALIQIVSNKTTFLCESSQLGKISKLLFLPSSSKTVVFDNVYINLWGPTPIISINQFKYYAGIVANLFG